MCGRKLGFSSEITVILGNCHHLTKNGRTFQNGMAIVNILAFVSVDRWSRGHSGLPCPSFQLDEVGILTRGFLGQSMVSEVVEVVAAFFNCSQDAISLSSYLMSVLEEEASVKERGIPQCPPSLTM